MEKAGRGRKCEDWCENGRCILSIKVECWCKKDCCCVEVNLATLACWGYHQILNIGVSLSSHPPRTGVAVTKLSNWGMNRAGVLLF